MRLLPASEMSALLPHTARPEGKLMRLASAGPSLKPGTPLPAMVLMVPSDALTRRMRAVVTSVTSRSPLLVNATARGNDRHAAAPGPPSPLNTGVPQPASVVMARAPNDDVAVAVAELVGVLVAVDADVTVPGVPPGGTICTTTV